MRKFSYIMLLIALLSLVMPTMAFAQEAVEEAAAEVSTGGLESFAELVFGSGMVKWFKDGGWAMWPILIVAVY
ncbi:MAG TPA: MotA/TolQ/ExbB proton channel family protein, partial [Candidatus Cloacimonadota bacterium]|nr:MotA/TolQ/ExbB proton channel family protein [Candidatus Cloacimonadota bacterium]